MVRRLIDIEPWLSKYNQNPGDATAAQAVARAFVVQARQLTGLGLAAGPDSLLLKGRYEALTKLLAATRPKR